MSRRAKEPVADEARTRRLGLPELMVQAGLGDDSSYYVFPNPGAIIQCPNCGSLAVKIHTSRTRVLQDILPQAQRGGAFCRTSLPVQELSLSRLPNGVHPAYQFAAPKSRVTRRFEDFLVRESINRSLEKVSDIAKAGAFGTRHQAYDRPLGAGQRNPRSHHCIRRKHYVCFRMSAHRRLLCWYWRSKAARST